MKTECPNCKTKLELKLQDARVNFLVVKVKCLAYGEAKDAAENIIDDLGKKVAFSIDVTDVLINHYATIIFYCEPEHAEELFVIRQRSGTYFRGLDYEFIAHIVH